MHSVKFSVPLATCNLDQCRMAMRLRTGMLDIPGDIPGRYQGREGCLAPGCHPVTRGEEGPAEGDQGAPGELRGLHPSVGPYP